MHDETRRSIHLAPTTAAPGAARRELAWLAPYVDARRLDDLRLIVTELVANAVEHARRAGEAVAIDVDIVLDDRHVRLDVRDSGASFAPRLPPRAPALESVRGRGLTLVDHLSDRFGVAAPSHLWVEVERGAAGATLAP